MIINKYLLSLNRYSRSGKKTNNPKGIVLHQSDNGGGSAIELRNYFENLKLGKNAIYYSTHYIVGLEGEVVYCVPEEEIANHRGNCDESRGFISVTICTPDSCGEPSRNTLISLKALVRDISYRRGFNIQGDFLRHYDISGKKCPLYYAENSEKWKVLKDEIFTEFLIAKNLAEKSALISGRISAKTGIDSNYLKDILEEKSAPDISAISALAKALLEK